MPTVIRILAVVAAMVFAPCMAMAQPKATLTDGRTITLPPEFEGCSGEWAKIENGVQLYNAACGQSGVLAVGVMEPGSWMTPDEFIKLTAQEMGLPGDASQAMPMQFDGGKATFVCWLDSSSDTNDGLAICSLREPTVRLSVMRTAGTNAVALDKVKEAVTQISIR